MVHPPKGHDELYVDVGAYGVPLSGNFHYRESTQQLEAFVRKSYGFQLLYADNFLSEQDFHEMFDHTLYNRMRTQLGCSDAFPDVYNKVSRAARTC
jgi:delta24-sterol reductase